MKDILDAIVLTNGAFGLLCRVDRRFPRSIPRLVKILPSASSGCLVPGQARRVASFVAANTPWGAADRRTDRR